MPFRLAIVVNSNPINLINAHSLHEKPAREQCTLLLAAVASKKNAFIRV